MGGSEIKKLIGLTKFVSKKVIAISDFCKISLTLISVFIER